mgnify:CR=1 FL=1
MTVAAPVLPMKVTIRCSNWRASKDGPKLCDQKIATLDYTAFAGILKLWCNKCGKEVEFR